MKYVSKRTYINDRTKIIAFLLVVAVAVISSSHQGYTLALAIGSLVLLLVIRALILPNRWEKTIGEMVKKAPRDDIEFFISQVSRHLPVLSRKRKFLVVEDDYGYTLFDRWEAEKKSFLNKFNYIPMSTEYYLGIDIDQQSVILESLVSDFSRENNVSTSYSEDMRPSEYEYFCSELLSDNGWIAKTTKATGDQGVDVLAERPGLKVAIQCKKYSNPVGNKAVQEVAAGKRYWDSDVAVVVTNSTYTPSARELAVSLGVLLLHHDQLPNLLEIIEGVVEV